MILSVTVYILCLALILWGGRFAGFADAFHDDFMDLSATKSLCGLASVFIIFHHIAQEGPFCNLTHELSFFYDIGFLLVTIFFFCSGYGLTRNADTKPGYMEDFPHRRLHTVIVPFYVNVVLFALNYLYVGIAPWHLITGLLGLTMLNTYGWYPFVLFLMYLVFWFCQRHVRKRSAQLWIYFAASVLMIVLFSINGHFAWWAGEPGWWLQPDGFANAKWWMHQRTLWFCGECWINSSVGFVLGAAFATWQAQITAWFKKRYWRKLATAVALFALSLVFFRFVRGRLGYWSEFSDGLPGIGKKFVTGLAQLPVSAFFIVALFALRMKFRTENPATRFMGNITYETYLMGLVALESFQFLEYASDGNGGWILLAYAPANWNLAVYTVLVLVTTVLLGFLVHKLDTWILDSLDRYWSRKGARSAQ